MRLTPGSRAYLTGDKAAHTIREVVDGWALPWCEAIEEIALDRRPDLRKPLG